VTYYTLFLALGGLAGVAVVAIYDRRHDVLHGRYIERSVGIPDGLLLAEQVESSVLNRLSSSERGHTPFRFGIFEILGKLSADLARRRAASIIGRQSRTWQSEAHSAPESLSSTLSETGAAAREPAAS
jgi:hypothetical protein